jgi:hypothetical protein
MSWLPESFGGGPAARGVTQQSLHSRGCGIQNWNRRDFFRTTACRGPVGACLRGAWSQVEGEWKSSDHSRRKSVGAPGSGWDSFVRFHSVLALRNIALPVLNQVRYSSCYRGIFDETTVCMERLQAPQLPARTARTSKMSRRRSNRTRRETACVPQSAQHERVDVPPWPGPSWPCSRKQEGSAMNGLSRPWQGGAATRRPERLSQTSRPEQKRTCRPWCGRPSILCGKPTALSTTAAARAGSREPTRACPGWAEPVRRGNACCLNAGDLAAGTPRGVSRARSSGDAPGNRGGAKGPWSTGAGDARSWLCRRIGICLVPASGVDWRKPNTRRGIERHPAGGGR